MAATRRLAAIMFTDMVGFTALAQADEAQALRLLERHNEILRPIFLRFHGREVKTIGDSFLVEFESALDATNCALEIQRFLEDYNASTRDPAKIRLRIGIHLGDVVHSGYDVFGDSVNLASRMEPLADPGGICVSEPVFVQVRNKVSTRFEKLESKRLKNVRFPMDIFRVVLPWANADATPEGGATWRLAVLPLSNISPDPQDEYFSDGLTEELISVLSQLRELRVIARTSVNQYKTTSKTIAQIGSELGVASVLEGSVRKVGKQIRITMQLIDVGTQEHVWAESYNRELDDVFAIQEEIAERTAGALRLQLLGSDRAAIGRRATASLAAYDLYLRGLHAARRTALDGLFEAIDCFERATREDPGFSLAYSHWADALILLAGDKLRPAPAFARAEELLRRAVELDPNSSDAHAARANLTLQSEQDWSRAEEEFRRAIALNPSDAKARQWYAILLAVLQRFDEAREQLRTAVGLDPLWPLPTCWLIELYERLGDFASAATLAEEALAKGLEEQRWLHALLGIAYAHSGRREEAQREADPLAGGSNEPEWLARSALLALLGRRDEIRPLVLELERASERGYVPFSMLAGLYSALGETEKAIDLLERDSRGPEVDRGLWFDYQSACFDPIRADPRFVAILRDSNLPTTATWRSTSLEASA